MEPVRVGILGLGTVGCGTLSVLSRNCEEITRRAGRQIVVKKAAVRDTSKQRNLALDSIAITDDSYTILDDPEIDVVVELIGGENPAHDYAVRAINNGKHVVTANKELIALHGNELFKFAQEASVVVAFEAAVGGGISIIKALREGLTGNRIQSLMGIINGTSNYILTAMKDKGSSFEEVLKEAQQLGYAEADPTFDVEGIDAVHKLTILAAIAFGIPLQYSKVFREGIGNITYLDMQYATELGFTIKPMAITKNNGSDIEMRVHPCMIPRKDMIANVNGVMNAVLVNGDAVGETLFYGAGAGSDPTASAVVADLVDVVRTLTTDPENRVPHLAFQSQSLSDIPIVPMDDVSTANYLRMNAVNRAGVLAEVTKILGDLGISIESILQKGSSRREEILPVIIVTQQTLERNMNSALAQLEELPMVKGPITRIRMEVAN